MLRVTVQRLPTSIAFQLEGRLASPWLQELDACWQETLSNGKTQKVLLDLTGVTFVDKDGKAWLTAQCQRGAEFIAADCLTKAIVQEIKQTSAPPRGLRDAKDSNGRRT
jgi:anti-anti-sigma regulatory factor